MNTEETKSVNLEPLQIAIAGAVQGVMEGVKGLPDGVSKEEATRAARAAISRFTEAIALAESAQREEFVSHLHPHLSPLAEIIRVKIEDVADEITKSTATGAEVDYDEIEFALTRQEAANDTLVNAEVAFRSALIHLTMVLHLLDQPIHKPEGIQQNEQ